MDIRVGEVICILVTFGGVWDMFNDEVIVSINTLGVLFITPPNDSVNNGEEFITEL